MDPMTSAVLSSAVYDMIKHSVRISGEHLKQKLRGWAISTSTSEQLASELNRLELNHEMSESAINSRLVSSSEIVSLLSEIKPNNTTIIQTHSGTGDNVAGNKIIK